MQAALEEVLKSIGDLSPVERDASVSGVDERAVPRLIEALDTSLREGNFEAAQRLDALTAALGGRNADELGVLSQAVRAFDFAAARAALRKLHESLSITSGGQERD